MLYLAGDAVPHAAASVSAAAAQGLRPAFVTNNASRRAADVAKRLTALGIYAVAGDVVTSAQAAVHEVARQVPPGSRVLVLGTGALAEQVAEADLEPVRVADPTVVAVVQGLSPTTSWTDLAEAAVALRAGALWVAGNADSTYPSPRGPLPGNGSLVAALTLATGRAPVVVGKPEPTLHRESVARVGASHPLVIGDRLDTDVLGAVRAGADSLLVLTGVVDRAELLAAPRGSRPTYVGQDLRALLEPQPPAVVDGGVARCAGATATYDAGRIVVDGSGPWSTVTALRASCALAWSRADAGR